MNKIIYLIMSCLILLSCEVTGYREVTLTGNRVLAKGDVEQGFNSLHISKIHDINYNANYNVEVIKGDQYSLEMSLDEALLPYLGYSIEDNTLSIYFNSYYGYFGNNYYSYTEDQVEIKVTITMPEIVGIWNDSNTTIDISSFEQFTELNIDGNNWDSSIIMAESIEVTNKFYLDNIVEGLEVITCGSFDSYYISMNNSDLTTIYASGDIHIEEIGDFSSLNTITGSSINLGTTYNHHKSTIGSIQGDSISITGSINVTTLTADSITLTEVLTIDDLTAINLYIIPGEETLINSMAVDTLSVTYDLNSNLTLPTDTTINNLTIMADDDQNITHNSINTENLTIITNSNSSVTINELEATNLTVVNSDSTVILPLDVTYETVDITLDDGIIAMGGTCNILEVIMMENSYYKNEVDLSTLNANETEVIMGSYNELILGTSNRIIYNLSNDTNLSYSGTPVSVTGLLGNYNIIINDEEVR